MKVTGRQPDSGNPTVRDERGACGNVGHGGARNPLYEPKGCMMETLHLKLSAPYFYPTMFLYFVRYQLKTVLVLDLFTSLR